MTNKNLNKTKKCDAENRKRQMFAFQIKHTE